MRLYNTLTRQEEEFAPSRDNTVRMYTCGLTVYNRGHIGNFRTFVCIDVLRRTFKYLCGFNVHQVMNFTDVTIAPSPARRRPACRCASTPTSTSTHSGKTRVRWDWRPSRRCPG